MAFVYVSSAEDGDIGTYTLAADGSLASGPRVMVGQGVMPMSISPDRRHLVAAVRAKPYSAHTFSIDRKSGALKPLGSGPLAESLAYIEHDVRGRWLLGASYGAHLVSVNPIGPDGKVGAPQQVVPTARNAHAIITDRSNRFVFVPHLGTDQVFQFRFDDKTGRLSPNDPPHAQMSAGSGPRHLVVSKDNRFVYLLCELTAEVVPLALDGKGTLTPAASASALAPGSLLVPGKPRPHQEDTTLHVWASDLHLTPDGRFLYAAERASSTIAGFKVDGEKLEFLGATATEKQPRGFRIDPTGRFMVVSGEKSATISTYAIESGGALRLVGKYPTGKGSNWVEIVSFD